jgi:hypothetical protein
MLARLTPFVFDMKLILDWAVTPTSLKLPFWMKMEDIAHELYSLLCDQEDTRVAHRMNNNNQNRPYPALLKVPVGSLLFAVLTFVLLFPLFLYSSLSPALQQNYVTGVSATLSIEGYPTMWSASSRLDASATDGPTASSPFVLNQSVVELVERTRPSLVGYGLSTNPVQLFELNHFSFSTWSISPPAQEELLESLNSSRSVNVIFSIVVRQRVSYNSAVHSDMTQYHSLSAEEKGNLSLVLLGLEPSVNLRSFYLPFIQNDQAESLLAVGVPSINTRQCTLSLNTNTSLHGGTVQYFSLLCHGLFELGNPIHHSWRPSPNEENCEASDACPNYEVNQTGFVFCNPFVAIVSTPVLAAGFLQTIGIVAAYTTFVLAIGRVLRFATTGGAYRTMLEDIENPSYLVGLIEYLYIARAAEDYELEMRIYLELVNTIRVTEELERKTKSQ